MPAAEILMRTDVKPEGLTAYVRELIDHRGLKLTGALHSEVLVKRGDELVTVFAKVQFATAPIEVRASRRYRSAAFQEAWLELEDALLLLQRMVSQASEGGIARRGDARCLITADRYGDSGSNGDSLSHWPEWRLEITASGDNVSGDEPLVAHGAPPFRYLFEAVRDWLWTGAADSPFRNAPTAIVVVPDVRGRLVSIDWRPNELSAVVEAEGTRADLQIQVVAEVGDDRVVLEGVPAVATTVLRLPEATRSVRAFLVHVDGTCLGIIDRHQEGLELGGRQSVEEQACADIDGGENESVEFKPFINKGHEKGQEVLQSAVAFANKNGGRIYIGVLDNGSVCGEMALSQASKGSPEGAQVAQANHIEKLIRDGTKPVPVIHTCWVTISGAPVLVVEVERSHHVVPVATHNNDIFVRKGSTNRKPETTTELPALMDRARRDSFMLR
jgi:hypothetical protein